jgi:CBS domain-containing protein
VEEAMIAADLMTNNPRTIRPTDTVHEALEALQSLEVRHLPVVDDENNLVGMLTDRDLGSLMRTFTEGADAERMVLPLSQRRVADFMSADVVSVDTDTDLGDVIDTLLEERIGAVPVVDGEGNVVGIISYVDVLRSVAAGLEPSGPRPGRPETVERTG